jgi:hypothetical protein
MPDGGTAQVFTYRRAVRGQFATLIMVAGGAGTGKTFSALRLARGMAQGGKVFVADTDNGRAKLYADEFEFEHLDLREPYRPKLFEDAAIAAQQQGAAVLIIDNFAHEHAGPGGLLEYHEEQLARLTKGDLSKRDALNMVAWIAPKMEHKHMRERLYQLNIPVILCCSAEKKIAMVLQKEGQHKGKTIPVDQGFVPICGADIPYAMTASFMLLDVARPGVPVPIKALLPALKPIIKLDQPLDEDTGAAIAAWMKGAKTAVMSTSAASNEEAKNDTPKPQAAPPPVKPLDKNEAVVAELTAAFKAVNTLQEHVDLVNLPLNQKRIEWLRKNKPELFRRLNAVIVESWKRCGGSDTRPARKQTDLEV